MKERSSIYKAVYPQLEILDRKRKDLRFINQALIVTGFFAVFFLLFLGLDKYFESGEIPKIYLFSCFFCISICGGFVRSNLNRFKSEFKSQVVSKLIEGIDPTFVYHPESHILEEEFEESQLHGKFNKYDGEDYVEGKFVKTDFRFSEVHAEYESSNSDNGKSRRTIFKGFFMVADFHKDFQGHTIVRSDRSGEGWLGRLTKAKRLGRKSLVKMENLEFEEEFDVYSTDQVEARYILSTSMLESVLKLRKRHGYSVQMAFLKSKVYIAIKWNKKFLEPPLKKSLLSEEMVWQYLEEIWSCLEIIEILNLNTRIWSKS